MEFLCMFWFLAFGYPLLTSTAFIQTLLLEETVHTIQYEEGWRHGSPHAYLFPTRWPSVLQSQNYNCKLKALRINSIVLDSRHRKDQLNLDGHYQSTYRKTHLCETTPDCTNNITVGTAERHYLAPQHCVVYQYRCRERGQTTDEAGRIPSGRLLKSVVNCIFNTL